MQSHDNRMGLSSTIAPRTCRCPVSLSALVCIVTFSDTWIGPGADGARLYAPLVLTMGAAGASSLGFFGIGLRAIVAVGALLLRLVPLLHVLFDCLHGAYT